MPKRPKKRKIKPDEWMKFYYKKGSIPADLGPSFHRCTCGEYRKISRHELICRDDRSECPKCGSKELRHNPALDRIAGQKKTRK